MMKDFKHNHSIINNESFMDEDTLVLANKVRKDGFQHVSYGFGYDFHDDVEKGYGSIVSGSRRVVIFRNKCDIGFVELFGADVVVEDLENNMGDFISHYLQ